nr:family 20 glycosylhydrolase [Caballeronia sp. BR00000012568055]
MRWKRIGCGVAAFVAACAIAACSGSSDSNSGNLSPTARVAALGGNLMVRVSVDANDAGKSGTDCASLGADSASCARGRLVLENTGSTSLAAGNWTLYIHSIRRILSIDNPSITWRHITGDLYALTPQAGAFTLNAGERIEVPFVGEYWYDRYSDLLPRSYVVTDNAPAVVLRHNDTDDETQYVNAIPPSQDDAAAFAASPAQVLRARAEAAMPSAQQTAARALPSVLRETQGEGTAHVGGIELSLSGLSASQKAALQTRVAALGLGNAGLHVSGQVVGGALPADIAMSGGYRLTITANGASIDAFDNAGLYYGVQTLLSLTPSNGGDVPVMSIEDAPRYAHRGMHVDVARNFHQPATLRRLIDQMSAYKLNRLHLHLSDDEGWRIEIPGLPELTSIGGQRCHDLTETRCLVPQLGSGPDNRSGGGYLSRADYVALVRYASDRFVDIVPEIDMPGHARAAVVSMEARYRRLAAQGDVVGANAYRLLDPADTSNVTTVQFYDRRSFINPCSDSARRFVTKVISEVASMHREAGAPLSIWHFGGDEAKNILLGGGFQNLDGTDPTKGKINLAAQDKPFARSPMCSALIASGKAASVDELPSMFARQVSQIVKANGIGTMAAWQDGIKHASGPGDFATSNMMVTMWDTIFWGASDTVQSLSSQGYKTVLALPDYLYFDFPYSYDQHERGYYWGSHATDNFKVFSLAPDNLPQNAEIMGDRDGKPFEVTGTGPAPKLEGIQGQAWAEVMRNDQQFEYMVYPRLLALSERAWHRASWERPYVAGERYKMGDTDKVDKAALAQDWAAFASVVQNREMPKLTRIGAVTRPTLTLTQ